MNTHVHANTQLRIYVYIHEKTAKKGMGPNRLWARMHTCLCVRIRVLCVGHTYTTCEPSAEYSRHHIFLCMCVCVCVVCVCVCGVFIHVYVYIYVRLHVCVHGYVHFYVYAYMRAKAYMYTYMHTFQTSNRKQLPSDLHTYIHTYIYTHIHTYIHICTPFRPATENSCHQIFTPIYIYTYIHTYIHICTPFRPATENSCHQIFIPYTYIHTYIHIYTPFRPATEYSRHKSPVDSTLKQNDRSLRCLMRLKPPTLPLCVHTCTFLSVHIHIKLKRARVHPVLHECIQIRSRASYCAFHAAAVNAVTVSHCRP